MEKIFEGFVVLNWKSGSLAAYRRKPKLVSAYQIPIKMKLTVKIPDKQDIELQGEITLSQSKIEKIFMEEI